jgi:hypothetical protein
MSRLWVVMRGVALLALLAVGLHLAAAPAAAEVAIPQGSIVHSATMSIYVSQASGQPVYLHRVTAPWEESTVTWNGFAGSYDGLVVGSFLADAVGWRTADLTALVQDWVNGTFPNYGVYMEQGLTFPFSLYSSSDSDRSISTSSTPSSAKRGRTPTTEIAPSLAPALFHYRMAATDRRIA